MEGYQYPVHTGDVPSRFLKDDVEPPIAATDAPDGSVRGSGPGERDAETAVAEPNWFADFMIDRSTRKPSEHTLKAYRQDFIAVARINHFPSLLVAHPSTGIKTVAELIKMAKEKPGTLNYSSGGVGNFVASAPNRC